MNKWYAAHPEERRAANRRHSQDWRRDHPDRARALNKRLWAAKVQQRVEVLGRQGAQCDACGKVGPTVFDHCHSCGVARGWLCGNCNLALGHTADDVNRLRKLADYAQKHEHTEEKKRGN